MEGGNVKVEARYHDNLHSCMLKSTFVGMALTIPKQQFAHFRPQGPELESILSNPDSKNRF